MSNKRTFAVRCSAITGKLYAGYLLKNDMMGQQKWEVTETACKAVAQHLLQRQREIVFPFNGEIYTLKVEKVVEPCVFDSE